MFAIQIFFLGPIYPQTSVEPAPTAQKTEVKKPTLREDLTDSLKPPEVGTQDIVNVYRDMVVVQRKAKEKAGRFLFHTFGSFDFSDGPTTQYGLNLNLGYALSDYFEVYANFVPLFVANEREVVKQVRNLVLVDGDKVELTYSKPKLQYGVDLLWAPAYGKDSWGPYSIVRSDTFIKLGIGSIQYEQESGMRFSLTVGKTFFLSRMLNLRLAAGGAYLQAVIGDQVSKEKKFYMVGLFETGLVWYL